MEERAPDQPRPPATNWLNENVVGMALTSLLADASHEMATTALPGFIAALQLPPSVLGLMEGTADALSSFSKLASGWWSDRLEHRKPVATAGYLLSGAALALFALAVSWPLLFVGRVLAWFGRGVRSPIRSALLAESVSKADRGKAFGLHRAGDTLGAIIGPLVAWAVLTWLGPSFPEDVAEPFRLVFLYTLLPGLGAALAFSLLVTESPRTPGRRKFWASVLALPTGFRRLIGGVGCFGAGDFAVVLLIYAAGQLLSAAGIENAAGLAALLYAWYNAVYAGMSYPVGHLSDHWDRRTMLAAGYGLGALVMVGFGVAFLNGSSDVLTLALLFGLAGVFRACVDTLEDSLAADLLPDETIRGTGYGVLSSVNGVGDFVSSAVVGLLWTVHPALGFGYAAAMMSGGAWLLLRWR